MGFLTTIVIRNDALHSFRDDPKAFGEAVLKGVSEAHLYNKDVNIGFKCYANYITVFPSRHADDETLYLHSGNCLFQLDPNSNSFISLKNRNLKLLKDFLKRANRLIIYARSKLNKK